MEISVKRLFGPAYIQADGGVDSYVKLYLRGNGDNASTTITDSEITPKTVTVVGGAKITTSTFALGTGSIALNGTDAYLTLAHSADWYFDGDWTIDGFMRFDTLPASGYEMVLFEQITDTSNLWRLSVYNDSGTYKFRTLIKTTGSDILDLKKTITGLYAKYWYYFSFLRTSTNWKAYFNAGQCGTTDSDASVFTDLTGVLNIGANAGGGSYFCGQLEGLRVSKGVARTVAIPQNEHTQKFMLVENSSLKKTVIRSIFYYNANSTTENVKGWLVPGSEGCLEDYSDEYRLTGPRDIGATSGYEYMLEAPGIVLDKAGDSLQVETTTADKVAVTVFGFEET